MGFLFDLTIPKSCGKSKRKNKFGMSSAQKLFHLESSQDTNLKNRLKLVVFSGLPAFLEGD
jgi:hypothetical protein